ncbi:MAG: hypothetical protein IJP92_17565 [Lachnospiraceae bacterium]|nr:hypothetical protein [Lachnospiraceae bacterium]
MICASCNSTINDNSSFCVVCGAPVQPAVARYSGNMQCGMGYAQQNTQNRRPMAIAGFVLGLISILILFLVFLIAVIAAATFSVSRGLIATVGVLTWLSPVLSILGIVFSALAKPKQGLALAGMILSCISLLLFLLLLILGLGFAG